MTEAAWAPSQRYPDPSIVALDSVGPEATLAASVVRLCDDLGFSTIGEGIETHLFFTFWGFDIINKATMADLKFSFVGNTAMHPPGHSGLGVHHMLGALPGATAMATKMMKKQISDLDVPEVPEFLEQISESGGHLWACRMSADMMKLHEEDLYDGVEGIISATDFIELTDGAQLLFI